MKRDERKQGIMDLLFANGSVELDDLTRRFAVSKMTIHRDLDDLEAAGVMRKIRGGGTIEAGTGFESDFRFRAQQDRAAKSVMAETALALVEPGMIVMINDGSMSAILGARLVEKRPLSALRADIAFVSAPAIAGTDVFHMDESVVGAKHAMMKAGARTCLLVIHSRFGRTALHRLADLSEFDVVITDAVPDPASVEALTQAGLSLTIATPKEGKAT